MKRNGKAFLTIAALAMAATIALAGCPNDDSNGNNNGGGGGSIVGTWKMDSQAENRTLIFTATTVTIPFMGDYSATYTLTGTTLVEEGYTGKAVITATTMVISEFPEARSFFNATWIRQ